jgi:hypothetical protein
MPKSCRSPWLYWTGFTILLFTLTACRTAAPDASNINPEPSQRQDPLIQTIVNEVSEERIAGIMRKLESFETRNTMSDPSQTNRGIGAARQWILDEFKSYSPRLQVSFDTYNVPKTNRIYKDVELRNVIAILPGRSEATAKRWILVSGHYDSVNMKDALTLTNQPAKAAELPAPGVSDDASGTACAMECARVLSHHDFDATLVFVAFAGEEQGLYGAKYLARRLHSEHQEIEAVLDSDIIGNEISGNGRSDNRRVLLFSEDPNDSASRAIARFVRATAARYYPEMVVDLIFRHDRFQRGGDHTAFNGVGYAGVRFTTPSENFANQHSATDTFANSSPAYAARVVRINAAAAAEMALAPRMPITSARRPRAPTGSETNAPASAATAPADAATRARTQPGLTRGASGYDAVLRWEEADPEPNLAGFIVVMRSTTSVDWEREFWVGNVREFTLKNTPIDQVVLGVKAVDQAGHESPVSAYVTQPSAEDAPLREAR